MEGVNEPIERGIERGTEGARRRRRGEDGKTKTKTARQRQQGEEAAKRRRRQQSDDGKAMTARQASATRITGRCSASYVSESESGLTLAAVLQRQEQEEEREDRGEAQEEGRTGRRWIAFASGLEC